jgi:hypothetical protein
VDDDDMMMNKKAKEQQHVPFYDTVGTIFERQSMKSRKVSMSAEFGIGGSIKNSTKSSINSALLDSVMNNYASYKGGSASSATVAPTTTVLGGVGSSSSKNTTTTTTTTTSSGSSTKTTANNSHHDLSELLAPPSSQFSTMGSRKSSKENNNNLRRKSISLSPTQEEGESNKKDSLVDLVRIKPLSSPTGLLSPSADPRVYPSSQKVSISAAANTVMASNRVHGARRKSIAE